MTRYSSGSRGTSFIDLIISMGIIAVLFGGIYLVYFSVITSIANISVRAAATAAIQAEVETIRNLPYDSVGTVGGAPAGVIPPLQTAAVGNYSFALQTTVRNIDDPFDGTVNGTPADTAPADYKLVSIVATCPLCSNYISVGMTTTVAPKNLESATQNGSLFIYALNANGNPVPGATVHVVNASVTPSIDLTDTTNASSGVLQLVGVPTSTQGYAITVTKPGYSTDRTYPPGALSNPNPAKPNATVAVQTVTSITFAIDAVSTLNIVTSDNRCTPFANEPVAIQGSKLIGGPNPNVLKFSTTTMTGANGSTTLPNMEWDTYILALNDATKDVAGTIPLSPLAINPGSTVPFRFVLQSAADPSLLVTVVDAATGAGIPNATVTASQGGFSKTLAAGHAFVSQNNWSGGQFSSQSGGINASVPGKITLLANASGSYPVMSNDWLISNTFDLGGSNSTLYGISWQGTGNISFQVAADNDNATWNFMGPDGTSGTLFTVSSSSLPVALSGNRYLRYRTYLNTPATSTTPELDGATFEFSANCVPQSQVLFTGLAQGAYTVNASAQNYAVNSSTVSVGAGTQSSVIPLTHS